MKKILPLLLFLLATAVLHKKSAAQKNKIDTTYHLFFYKGKKVKENVLLTPPGDTVSYNPAKRTLKKVSKSGTGKELDNMLAEINRTDQRMNEMMQKLVGGLPRTVAPYYAKPLKESYDDVKEVYASALSNTMKVDEIPGFAEPSAPQLTGRKNIFEETIEQLKIKQELIYQECRDYIRKHQNENIEVPTPPEKDYRYCSQCDNGIKERYKKAYAEFHEKLQGEESKLLGKLLAIERARQLSGRESELDGDNITDSTIKFIMKRMGKKANLLMDRYGNDPLRIGSAVPAALSMERTRQLLGFDDSDENALKMSVVSSALKNFLTYLDKAVDEKDYTIALNPGLILSCFRQYMLMGGSDKDIDNMKIFEKAINLNSFKLNIKVSGKLSGSNFMQLAELKGDNYFAAVLDSASKTTCRLKWVLLGPDPEKKHMQFDLTDVKMEGEGKEIVYAGTKKWKSPPPKLRIDFCDNGNDTAMITSFRPDGKETWIVPEYGPMDAPYMSNVLLGCFMDIDRLKKEANKEEMEKKMEEMKRQAEEFKKNYATGQTPSPSQVSTMMNMSKGLSAGSMISDMMQEYAIGSYLILPKPQNKNKVVFEERLDGKKLFPENPKIEYGWLEITLEQDADSLFKMKM